MNIIKDTLPLQIMQINKAEEELAKKLQIPLFKGKLFQVDDYGNEIFKNDNTIVLGGAIMALERVFGVASTFRPPTLNSIYNVNSSITADENQAYVKMFGLGVGGAGLDFGNVKDPDFKQKEIADFIPLRLSDTTTLSGVNASKYFFRRQISSSPVKYAWYLKEFENVVTIKSLWKDSVIPSQDGTEITGDVSGSSSTSGIESFGECVIKISPEDIVDYFNFNGNIEMSRYNSIGLFSGTKVSNITAGYNDYVNVRLFSVVNINNDEVKANKNITYRYRIYSAV